MQVFNLCLKILRKNLPLMIMYIGIFLGVSLIMSLNMSNERKKESLFSGTKSDIAFISEENSIFIEGLKNELGKVANFVGLPEEKEALQDALFFREVSYILRIPEGFTEDFMNGGDMQLEKTVVPGSASNIYIDIAINKYLNTARLYIEHVKDISQESLVKQLESDLSTDTSVELMSTAGNVKDTAYSNYFYNYMAYSLLYILILGVSVLMLVFHDSNLKKRNACSPINAFSVNMQFMGAILLLTFASWLIMVVFCIMFNLENALGMNTVCFIMNSFVFAICGASLSFLIGNLVKSRSVISAASNVVTLGFSFISGVFVPQQFIADFVLRIASFTPTYWFVRANNRIAELTQFDFSSLQPVFSDMLMQFGFALAFLAVALVVGKRRSLA
ncbi:MAG: ABC transporter permease [Acetivibrionales bacterium]|jgi:ABC-2 type transport system permease protein